MWRTAVDDTAVVDVLDGLHDRAYEVGRVAGSGNAHKRRSGSRYRSDLRLVVVALGAYPVEELAARAEVEAEVEVVRGLSRVGV